jgi:uncharacterized protein YbaP (TraB family)
MIKLADRLSTATLAVLGFANLVFILALLAAMLAAVPKVRAGDAACGGTDLVAGLEQSDPALLERLRREASAIPNGRGLLWKVEKDGLAPSYLFGTMHLTDGRVTTLRPAVRQAFEASRVVIIETTDILDPQAAAAELMRHPELAMLTDGSTLKSMMSAEDQRIVADALAEHGIAFDGIDRMQPWLVTAMVSVPACEAARRNGGEPVLDLLLAREAAAAGKEVGGLETMVGQFEAMASLPREFHVRGLIETLKLGSLRADLHETMILLYAAGETGLIWPLFRAIQPSDDDGSGLADFERAMITTRNRAMAANAATYLAKGGAFIAVGALHLPGREGLVELLKKDGFRLQPVE